MYGAAVGGGVRITRFYSDHRVDRLPVVAEGMFHRLAIAAAELRSPSLRRATGQLKSRLAYLNRVFPYSPPAASRSSLRAR